MSGLARCFLNLAAGGAYPFEFMMSKIKCPKCGASLMPTTLGFQMGRVDCPVCMSSVSIAHARAAEEIASLRARGKRAAGTPIQLDSQAGDDFDIQWMPPGYQQPVAFVSGESRQLNFTVKPEHAQAFDGQLQRMIELAKSGNGDLPFIDFNHEDGAASGRPAQFYWGGDDPKKGGIRLKGTWTTTGKAAITGPAPEFTRFSPEWYFDDNDEPIAVGANLGGLVNRAAFKSIATVTAADASDSLAADREQLAQHPFLVKAAEMARMGGMSESNALRHLQLSDPGLYQSYLDAQKKCGPRAQAGDLMALASNIARARKTDAGDNDTAFKSALFKARQMNPAAAATYDAEKATLDRHPFMNRARALAAEHELDLQSAVAHLARTDFPLYQNYLAAHGKLATKVTISRGKAGQERFFKAVEFAKGKGMSHADALVHIAETRPDLYEEFRQAR